MIVVDTSVWVAALRDGRGREARVLAALATEMSARVWSLDSDVARMSRAGLIQLYDPRA